MRAKKKKMVTKRRNRGQKEEKMDKWDKTMTKE